MNHIWESFCFRFQHPFLAFAIVHSWYLAQCAPVSTAGHSALKKLSCISQSSFLDQELLLCTNEHMSVATALSCNRFAVWKFIYHNLG